MHPAPDLILNNLGICHKNPVDACNFALAEFKQRIPILVFSALSYIKLLAVMNSEEGLSGKTPKNTGRSPKDICVLLLDSDPTCLTIISKMLQKTGYRVVTAERAADALHILKDKDGEIDLIMAEAHLSDMDKYELLETIAGISKLPIVVMAAEWHENSALGCLYKGARHYMLKPLVMGDLKHLWQITISHRRGIQSQLDGGRPKQNGAGNDSQALNVAGHTEDNKRKELAEIEHKEDNYDNYELRNQMKSKLICADELQNGSMQGVGTEVNQVKKRAEKPKESDNHELRNQKIRKFSCVGELQSRSPDAIKSLRSADNNKNKERVEMEIYEEYDVNSKLGTQKQPELLHADAGDLGFHGAYLDENLQHVIATGLADANVLPHEQEQVMPVTAMYETVSNVLGGVPLSKETNIMQSLGTTLPPLPPLPLSPAESSSDDHMWKQMRQPVPSRGPNLVEIPQQNAEDNNPAVGDMAITESSELFCGNILELAELLRDDPVPEQDLQEEEGSSSDVLEKSPDDLFDETFKDIW